MNALERYQLKKKIDAVVSPYGASAQSWPCSWWTHRIVKYDCPWWALRTMVYERTINGEADWLAHQDEIIAELKAGEPRRAMWASDYWVTPEGGITWEKGGAAGEK